MYPVGGSSTTTEIPEIMKKVVPVMDPANTGYGGKNSILFKFSSLSYSFSGVDLNNLL